MGAAFTALVFSHLAGAWARRRRCGSDCVSPSSAPWSAPCGFTISHKPKHNVAQSCPAPLLFLDDIHLTYGTTRLLDGAALAVNPGERLCIVGRNGSGKSTLLKIAAVLLEPDGGERFLQPGVAVRYLPQEPDLAGLRQRRCLCPQAGLTEGDDAGRAHALLGMLGLTGEETPAHLSGGEARRASLARTLAAAPDILLLDEPTNHLDLPVLEWLEDELKAMRSALVLISHDRRFLDTLSRSTLWLDRGRTRTLDKGFAAFEPWRDEVLAAEELERHKLDRKIVMEEHWVRYGVTARRKRNQGRMARLGELRRSRREQLKAVGSVKFADTEAGAASGTRVIEAERISKSFGELAVVKDFSIRILKGDRIGIVGPNGAGKTTLLKLLTGALDPDSGEVMLGTRLAFAGLDQRRTLADEEKTVSDTLTGGGDTIEVAGQKRHIMGYLKDFLFLPEQARAPVRVLSGGERARLLLAKALSKPSNLLVLDEPTNDLDLDTLDLLEEMIADYPGTALIVSHDRDFLDRTATAILVAEGQGIFREYAGGYSDMLAQRGAGIGRKVRTGADGPAEKPAPPRERVRERKLSFPGKARAGDIAQAHRGTREEHRGDARRSGRSLRFMRAIQKPLRRTLGAPGGGANRTCRRPRTAGSYSKS